MYDRNKSDPKSVASLQKKKRCHHVGVIKDKALKIVWIK
jgi:hypothetical protein